MPATQQDYDKIQEKRKEARGLVEESSMLESKAGTFADRLMADVRKARVDRGVSKLAEGVGTTMGQLAKGGAEIRERTAGIDPLRQDVITARERAGTLGRLGSLATKESERYGTIQDVLGAGANQIRAMAAKKSAEAELATAEARDLREMVELKTAQEARNFQEMMAGKEFAQKEEQYDIAQQQWEDEFGLKEKETEYAINKPYYKSTKDSAALELLVQGLLQGQGQGQSTTQPRIESPMSSPAYAGLTTTYKGNTFISDNQGNWIYQGPVNQQSWLSTTQSVQTSRPPLDSNYFWE